MTTRALKIWETIGWVAIAVLSMIGVSGSLVHLLDSGFAVGDVDPFRRTTETLYGHDFAPHWYAFRDSPMVRVAHMAPGLVWMIFAPLQLVGRIRRAAPRFHRWVGRVALAMTVILVPSGVVFAALHPFAGAFEELAPICFYTVIYLVAVTLGVRAARRREFATHREWMIRAFAIGIGISSVRVWFVVFMHTTGLHAQAFFATTFWLAFGVNLVIAELWIHATRGRAAGERLGRAAGTVPHSFAWPPRAATQRKLSK